MNIRTLTRHLPNISAEFRLQKKNFVTVNPSLRDQLRSENTKRRNFGRQQKPILTKELRNAAKELKNDPDIVIRKADKSNMYVILNTKAKTTREMDLVRESVKIA